MGNLDNAISGVRDQFDMNSTRTVKEITEQKDDFDGIEKGFYELDITNPC